MAAHVVTTEQGFASTRAQDDQNVAAQLDYSSMLGSLNATFNRGVTKNVEWRRKQLQRLKEGIISMHEEITAAVRADLGGPRFRGIAEIAGVDEIDHILANLDEWVKPTEASFPLFCDLKFLCNCWLVAPFQIPLIENGHSR